MVEIFEKKPEELVKYEKEKVDVSLIHRKTNAQSYRGYLQGLIIKAKRDKNKELEILIQEILNKYDSFGSWKVVDIEIEGWKGKDSYELYKGFDSDFRIIEIRKDKFTKEITKSEPITIKREHINYMLYLVKSLKINEHSPARSLWERIISHYDLKSKGIDILNFNGGGNHRAVFYFPLYLYPSRVLEKLGYLRLSGGKGGGVIRLK